MPAARIQADLVRFEAALRPAYDQRGALKSASVSAWTSCMSSLLNIDDILETSSFADGESGGGTKWVQWRKSNASKQLICLLKSAIEAAAAMPATRCSANMGTTDAMATQVAMLHVLKFYSRTQRAALWPALREWLSEEPHQHGLQDLWRALAWSLEATKHALRGVPVYGHLKLAIFGIHSALHVSLSPAGLLPRHLQQHPSLVAALRLVMGSALPGLINFLPYAGTGLSPERNKTLIQTSLSVLDNLTVFFAQQLDAQLWDQFHPLALSLWTDAAAAVKRWSAHAVSGEFLRVRCFFIIFSTSANFLTVPVSKLASHSSSSSFDPTLIAAGPHGLVAYVHAESERAHPEGVPPPSHGLRPGCDRVIGSFFEGGLPCVPRNRYPGTTAARGPTHGDRCVPLALGADLTV